MSALKSRARVAMAFGLLFLQSAGFAWWLNGFGSYSILMLIAGAAFIIFGMFYAALRRN